MGSGRSESKTHVKILSREVKMTYLQSVQIVAGDADVGLLAGEGGGVGSHSSSQSDPGRPGFLGIPFLGGKPASSSSMSTSDSGWVINRQWRETHFDKVRYVIGLKDIGIFFYEFTDVSEIVSVPFRSPKEIAKVELRVVEQIPTIFKPDRRYIEYYVSPDSGNNWYRINPLDHPTITGDDGQIVPRTITFNTDVGAVDSDLQKFVKTAEPVFALRYRAVLRSDTTVQDSQRYSPILKKISMLIYPKGGLRELSS